MTSTEALKCSQTLVDLQYNTGITIPALTNLKFDHIDNEQARSLREEFRRDLEEFTKTVDNKQEIFNKLVEKHIGDTRKKNLFIELKRHEKEFRYIKDDFQVLFEFVDYILKGIVSSNDRKIINDIFIVSEKVISIHKYFID